MATEVGKGYVEVTPDFKKFGLTVNSELSAQQSTFQKFGAQQGAALKTAFSGAVAGVGVAAAVGIGLAVKSSIQAASDLNEQLSKTDAVFDSSAGRIKEWADTAVTSFGQSKTQALEAASSFGNMFLQLGIGADQATNMSMSMTELASDFASFFNTNPADVLDAIAAAFRGEFDAVQKFVPTINAAAVQQKALEMGLAATTKELTEQDKALAAYELIMTGAGEAAGDFDKTSGSLANTQRTLQASVSDLSAELGNSLAPLFGEVLTVALSVVNAIRDVDEAVRSLNEAAGQNKGGGGLLKQLTGIDIKWGRDLADVNWDGTKKGADDTAESVRALALAIQDGKDGIAGYNDVAAVGVGVMSHFGATADAVAQQLDRNVEGMLNLGVSADAVAQNIGNEADALRDAEDAARGLLNAQLALFDSTFAVSDAQRSFNDAAIEANSTTEDQQAAFDEAAKAALGVAAATVKYAEDQATLAGESLNAEEATQIQIQTLETLAAQIGGPVADTILGMVEQLKTLDQTNADPDATLNDQATQPLIDVKSKVDGLDAARASVSIDANTSAANSKIDALRTRLNNASRVTIGGGGLVFFQEGGLVGGPKDAPVPAIVHGGEYVLSADMVDRIRQGAPSRGALEAAVVAAGGVGARSPIVIVNQGTFLGTEEAFGKLADRAIAEARRSGHRVAA